MPATRTRATTTARSKRSTTRATARVPISTTAGTGRTREVNFHKPNNTLKTSREQRLRPCRTRRSPSRKSATRRHDGVLHRRRSALLLRLGGDLCDQRPLLLLRCSVRRFRTAPTSSPGTSFGHLTTSEIIPAGGYKPITGTIYDLMDANGVSWADYYSDLPYSVIFRRRDASDTKPRAQFATDAAAGTLPQVVVHRSLGLRDQIINGIKTIRPTSIRRPTSAPASILCRRSSTRSATAPAGTIRS